MLYHWPLSSAFTFSLSCMQTMLRLTQSASLSASCSRLLLQITSSLLLGENITLPKSLIQEMIQKVCPWTMKIRFHLCVWQVSWMWRMWIVFFSPPQDFQQHVRARSNPGIHKGDVHYERIWTGESLLLHEFVCFSCTSHMTDHPLPPPTPSFLLSSSSSFPPCCVSLPACSAVAILTPATLVLMCWSAWSLPKPHPPQMAPWLLKPTPCSSPDRPQGQIPRKKSEFFLLYFLPCDIKCVFFPAGFLAKRSSAALQISPESHSLCCLWSLFLRRRQSSLICHCCGALWCFCHTSGNTHIPLYLQEKADLILEHMRFISSFYCIYVAAGGFYVD